MNEREGGRTRREGMKVGKTKRKLMADLFPSLFVRAPVSLRPLGARKLDSYIANLPNPITDSSACSQPWHPLIPVALAFEHSARRVGTIVIFANPLGARGS